MSFPLTGCHPEDTAAKNSPENPACDRIIHLTALHGNVCQSPEYDQILNDVRRAVRLLKSLAPSYGYPKNNIALLGFSAGGQVSLLGGTHFDDGNPNSPDPVERFSSRPDLILDPRFSLNLAIRLYEHNLPFELHVYDEGAHGIGLADDTNILKEYSSHHLNTWVSLCSEWLDEKFSR